MRIQSWSWAAALSCFIAAACAGHAESTLYQGGKVAFADRDYARAREFFSEQVARFPGGVRVLLAKAYLARIALKGGDAAGALQTLDEAFASAPDDALGVMTAKYWRGRALLGVRRWADALVLFSEVAATLAPEAEPATYFQGRALYRLGAYASAEKVLRERLRPTATFANGTRYWLGRSVFALGRYDDARGELELVPEASTWAAGASLYRLRCDLAQDRADAGMLAGLRAFSTRYPASQLVDLAALLEGEVDVQLADLVAARTLLSAFSARYPTSTYLDAAAFWSARAAMGLSQPAAAQAELSALLARRPSHNPLAPAIHVSLGECEWAQGQLAAAQVELETMLVRSPSSRWVDEAHFALVRVYADLGQCSLARQHAAALAPGSKWTAPAVAYLQQHGC